MVQNKCTYIDGLIKKNIKIIRDDPIIILTSTAKFL